VFLEAQSDSVQAAFGGVVVDLDTAVAVTFCNYATNAPFSQKMRKDSNVPICYKRFMAAHLQSSMHPDSLSHSTQL
jgi:hypothetical protein